MVAIDCRRVFAQSQPLMSRCMPNLYSTPKNIQYSCDDSRFAFQKQAMTFYDFNLLVAAIVEMGAAIPAEIECHGCRISR